MAEKSSWDQANRRQKLGLGWKNGKKILPNYQRLLLLYLPFFLLIIVWIYCTGQSRDLPFVYMCVTLRQLMDRSKYQKYRPLFYECKGNEQPEQLEVNLDKRVKIQK